MVVPLKKSTRKLFALCYIFFMAGEEEQMKKIMTLGIEMFFGTSPVIISLFAICKEAAVVPASIIELFAFAWFGFWMLATDGEISGLMDDVKFILKSGMRFFLKSVYMVLAFSAGMYMLNGNFVNAIAIATAFHVSCCISLVFFKVFHSGEMDTSMPYGDMM